MYLCRGTRTGKEEEIQEEKKEEQKEHTDNNNAYLIGLCNPSVSPASIKQQQQKNR